ncbi:MAG: hypothetical protein ABSG84_01410 [Acidobacteriaceae bacterium]|jgi:hypothetical protein
MSRVTLFSLLLALLLGVGIRLWTEDQRDACTPYLAGDTKVPSSEWVMSGTRTIEVSCNDWIMRQPLRVQILCLVDVILAVLFLLNALSDLREWLEFRRRMRQMG